MEWKCDIWLKNTVGWIKCKQEEIFDNIDELPIMWSKMPKQIINKNNYKMWESER